MEVMGDGCHRLHSRRAWPFPPSVAAMQLCRTTGWGGLSDKALLSSCGRYRLRPQWQGTQVW